MKLAQLYSGPAPAISFELFPPNSDEGLRTLGRRLPRLIGLGPDFITVTYGAMGSSRDRTLEIASRLRNDLAQEVAHHLTCVGSDESELSETIARIRGADIENIVALRGDPPRGQKQFEAPPGGYRYAYQLVEHLRKAGDFGIAVAGYPEKHIEATSRRADLTHLKRKVDAGADVVITQLFYDNRHYFEFVDSCQRLGLNVPIIPGLLPIMDVGQIERITKMCGSSLQPALLEKLRSASSPREVITIGVDHTVSQVTELLGQGVRGIHFYVLNRYTHIKEIMEAIGR